MILLQNVKCIFLQRVMIFFVTIVCFLFPICGKEMPFSEVTRHNKHSGGGGHRDYSGHSELGLVFHLVLSRLERGLCGLFLKLLDE